MHTEDKRHEIHSKKATLEKEIQEFSYQLAI